MGTNTDPYQPVERELGSPARSWRCCRAFNHPVGIVTKSTLVLRDIDILAPMAEKQSRPRLRLGHHARPRPRRQAGAARADAAAPARGDRALAEAGVPVGVMAAPMIPALTDAELERILEAAAAPARSSAGYVLLRLPLEIKDLFEEWLAGARPGQGGARAAASCARRAAARSTTRASASARRGTGPYAELIAQRFQLAAAPPRPQPPQLELRPLPVQAAGQAGDQLALF